LRLDTREQALASMVPGKPEESGIIEQISGEKPQMPKKAAPLTADQVGTLRRFWSLGTRTNRLLKDFIDSN